MEGIKRAIQALVDLETRGWDTQNPYLLLSLIHPDMVWPWPPHPDAHDPAEWVLEFGRFNRDRWRKNWQELFDSHDLIHNHRKIVKIEVSQEEDGAFAVVDIDTLWRNKVTHANFLWKGRVCKIYTKLANGEWKLIAHTGVLQYPPRPI